MLFFQTKIDIPLPVFALMIPSRTRQTVRPGGSIHQLPSAVTPHLTAANVDVWLSWKPERQVPFWPWFCRRHSRGPMQHVPCDGQEPVVCYGVSPPSANHTASCLFEQGPRCSAVLSLWRRKMKCKKLSRLSCHCEKMVEKEGKSLRRQRATRQGRKGD